MKDLKCVLTLISYKNNVKETITIEVPAGMTMEEVNHLLKRDLPGYSVVDIKRDVNIAEVKLVKPKYCFAIITDGNYAIAERKGGLIHLFGGGSELNENCNQAMFRELREELTYLGKPFSKLNLTGAFDARNSYYRGNLYLEVFYLIETDNIDFFSHNEGGELVKFSFDEETVRSLVCDDVTRYGLLSALKCYQERWIS